MPKDGKTVNFVSGNVAQMCLIFSIDVIICFELRALKSVISYVNLGINW